MCCHE